MAILSNQTKKKACLCKLGIIYVGMLAFVRIAKWRSNAGNETEDCDLPSAMELLKNYKDFFKDFRSDTAFNEMLCDARKLANEIDIPTNFELTQPPHRVGRRNVNFYYEAQGVPIEDPTLKYKAEFYFFTLYIDKAIMHLNPDTPQNDELKYCKDLETVLNDGPGRRDSSSFGFAK
ncbi:uncharacterized protein TNCV_1252721 [Trichonephila clavipes]|nr:uncharacterized protein TNCV_1252721 [Trichonephila clavipes]